jgi:4a-hydroxytetrahydrobiopterin dehydratase
MGKIILPSPRTMGRVTNSPLAERHCVDCKPGTPTLPAPEVDRLLGQLRGWTVVETDGHLQLTKTLKFKGFMPGVELVDQIARIAEAEAHHPDLHLAYGSLRVDLWTHAAGGLTENDFILAAKIDQIAPP